MKIVAMGGGEIGRPGHPVTTTQIDKEIILLSGKRHPKALFIPTASGDSQSYYKAFQKHYGRRLGCNTDVLYLINEKPARKEMRQKILTADIVYVGGGNTLRMMKLWRKRGVDKILKEAAKKDIVLSGLSAGAICWFTYGTSDSLKFGPKKSKRLIKVCGLGLVPFIACPHYDTEKSRRPSLRKIIKKEGGIAFALDNSAALEVVDQTYRIIASSRSAHAYRLLRLYGKVVEERLPADSRFRPLR